MKNDIFKLSDSKIDSISKNLVSFMKSEDTLSKDSANFIGNWILTGSEEKNKSCYELWNIVLKSYMPDKTPVLYRSCNRRNDGKIASFTGSIYSAYRFSQGKGFLIICNTSEMLEFEKFNKIGEYKHTFFPISGLLKKEAKSANCLFSNTFIDNYLREDEYIMRIDLERMYSLKWY